MRRRRAPAPRARAALALALALAIGGPALTTPAAAAPAAPAPEPPTVAVTDLPAGFQPSDINDRGRILGRVGPDVVVVDDEGGPPTTVGPWQPYQPACPPGPSCFRPSAAAPVLNGRGVVSTSIGGRATLWEGGELTDLNGDALGSWVLALNDRGQALVTRFTADGQQVGLWHRGRLTEIGRWGTGTLMVGRLSDRGHVALTTVTFAPPVPTAAVLFWHRGVGTPVEGFAPIGIDDGGRLVGQTGDPTDPASGREPAVWDQGEVTALPTMGAGHIASPSFVNDGGQIAGYGTPPSPAEHTVVRWDGGGIVDVGAGLGLRNLQLRELTDRGEVLVSGFTADFRTAGAVWDDGAIAWLPPGDGGEAAPIAMNDRGQVVGSRRGLDRTQPMTPTLWEL